MTDPIVPHRRLGWLDGLRGLAAIVVVYWHLGPYAVPALPRAWRQWVDLGKCGVVLFFLISGYVIAMSLERGGMRRFWIGRIFRVYPAWLVATAAMALVFASGLVPFPPGLAAAPKAAVLSHASMLQGLLGVSNFVPVYWTLSYEMLFYLVIGGLFALGGHRLAGWLAAALAAVALAGPALPGTLLTGADGSRRAEVAALLLLLLAGSVAGYASGRRGPALACAAAGLALVALPAVNGGAGPARMSWQSLILLAVMVAGAASYQADHGRVPRAAGVAVLAWVLAAGVAGAVLHLPPGARRRVWITTLLVAAAAFGAGWLLRHARVPPAVLWLGQISYSVYLLHLVLLSALRAVAPDLPGGPLAVRAAVMLAYLIAVLAAAELVYRLVERPGQALGRRLAGHLDARHPGRVPEPRRPDRRAVPQSDGHADGGIPARAV